MKIQNADLPLAIFSSLFVAAAICWSVHQGGLWSENPPAHLANVGHVLIHIISVQLTMTMDTLVHQIVIFLHELGSRIIKNFPAKNASNAVSSRFLDLLNSIIYDLKRSLDQRWLFDPVLHSSLDDLVLWKAATSQKYFILTRFVTFATYSTSVVHIDTGSHIEDTHRQQTHTGSMGLGHIMIITFLAQCESAGN